MAKIKPDVLARAMDEEEAEVMSEIELAFQESAMAHGFTIDYVRAIAVRLFTQQELDYALGRVT